MRTVGLFAEFGPERPDIFQGSIYDAVRAEPGEEEVALVEYLNNGIPLVDIMEATVDVISGGKYISGGSSILTDGVWVWRQDLAYYVAEYHLQLAGEFVRHAHEVSFHVPALDRDRLIDLAQSVARDLLGMA